MKKKLLCLLAVTSTCFSLPDENRQFQRGILEQNHKLAQILSPTTRFPYSQIPVIPIHEIERMIRQQAPTLNNAVLNKILTSLKCAQQYAVPHNEILTVIDYSLPSSEKRLWIFDLKEKNLLFYTYVSHGIRSGTLLTKYFSNKHDSKASSIGIYTTEQAYQGRDGLSLQLAGLDQGFNDNASNRAVVMHGGWYMAEDFIKRYGRPGRSWGCPALPLDLTGPIINTIKNKSLLVIYYPSDNWFVKSKFLNCNNFSSFEQGITLETDIAPPEKEGREGILFVDLNKNNRREESEPILVVTADNYERMFRSRPPLERMLRRQINNKEYIALSESELKRITDNSQNAEAAQNLTDLFFVVPDVKLLRGYYITQMKILDLGNVKSISPNANHLLARESIKATYTMQLDNRSVNLKSTDQFIRWLGL
jgi:hypothetical protein